MRILCFERDNVTQQSDSDADNCTYTASFELFPFHEGATYAVYKGIMNGDEPLRGSFCVVKAHLDKMSEAKDWTYVVRRAVEAQRLAKEFNKELGYPVVNFQIPLLTQMDAVSDFTPLFRCWKPHDKRLKRNEFITIEPFLKGTFQNFDSPLGKVPVKANIRSKRDNTDEADVDQADARSDTSSITPAIPANTTNLAQAFSHYTWHATGNLVVCGLQGVSNNGDTYTLTNPTIHSTDSRFGDSDGSTSAITEFFSTHRCNNICCSWGKYRNPANINVWKQVNYFPEQQFTPPYFHHNPAEPSVPKLLSKELQFDLQATLL